jgi:hypothetical protein
MIVPCAVIRSQHKEVAKVATYHGRLQRDAGSHLASIPTRPALLTGEGTGNIVFESATLSTEPLA